jgi:hypothetical protein
MRPQTKRERWDRVEGNNISIKEDTGKLSFPPQRASLIAHVSNFLKAVDMRVNHGLGNQHLMDASGAAHVTYTRLT